MTTASEYLIQRNKELEAEVERLKTENARIIDEADDIRAAADEGTVLFHKIADQRDALQARIDRALGITSDEIRSLIRRGVLRDDPTLLIRALYHEALGYIGGQDSGGPR
jgi:FtsZ-binding cell division protein ZapB